MLRGERVVLRARRREDVARLHSLLRDDPATAAWMQAEPYVPEPVERAEARYDRRLREEPDQRAVWLVVSRADGDPTALGEAGLWELDRVARTAHVGIGLVPETRGEGLGQDVLRVLCDYAFRVQGLHRLQVDTLAANAAMLGAAEAVGFRREGLLRQSEWYDGAHVDGVVLGLLAAEWQGSPAQRRQAAVRGTDQGVCRST